MSETHDAGRQDGSEPSASGQQQSRDEAGQRTDLAEDRTLLATERTYASWMRTGMASVAVALGFRALVRDFEPDWVARLVAIVFALTGAAIIWFAFRRACSVASELNSHEIRSMPLSRMRWLNYVLVAAALAVAAVLWFV